MNPQSGRIADWAATPMTAGRAPELAGKSRRPQDSRFNHIEPTRRIGE